MKKDFVADYFSYIGFRLTGFFVRLLPIGAGLFLGRQLGRLMYYLDAKHRRLAFANIKKALGDSLPPEELRRITKKFYLNFGQNIIEVFQIPVFNTQYINKYIEIEGKEYLAQAFKKGKGVILLGVHAGSWELLNVFWANLGFDFNLLVREQKQPRLNSLLNHYRRKKGCKLIERSNQTRQLITALKNNEAVGMTADQGGVSGELVKFLGSSASLPTGAIKLALKYGAVILPGYYPRKNGPYRKIIIEPPFALQVTGDKKADIRNNLAALAQVFEKNIRRYPEEYLWTYKIWKYGKDRDILILNDGKAGHLRQSQALAKIISECYRQRAINCGIETRILPASPKRRPDIVISCGSSLARQNLKIARENLAKAIAIMRPPIFSARHFDLLVLPEHDRAPKAKNICIIEGALNLIDEEYLREQRDELIKGSGLRGQGAGYIGLLIGGDSKKFHLKKSDILEVVKQIKSAAQDLNLDLLISTSRRTAKEIGDLLKEEFRDCPRCKLLIIANEKNLPAAVGGILGLSSIVVTSPESISMISEAANSKKYVLVFRAAGLSAKHRRFLQSFAEKEYIFLDEPANLSRAIKDIWLRKPKLNSLEDNNKVKEAIKKLI